MNGSLGPLFYFIVRHKREGCNPAFSFLRFSVTYISPYNHPPWTNTLICTHPVHCEVARGTHGLRLPAGDAVRSLLRFPPTFIFLSRLQRWVEVVEQFMYLLSKEEGEYATNFLGVMLNFDGLVDHLIHTTSVSVQGPILDLLSPPSFLH